MKTAQVHLCEGALAEVGSILEDLAARRVFLVADETAYRSSGAADLLEPAFERCLVTRFTDFRPNPQLLDVQRGIDLLRRADADVTIALGGGTAIDIAKSITRLAGQNAPPRDVITGVVPLQPTGPPLVAIPTTAGTGSEATHFAVVFVEGTKYSIAHDAVRPDYALIDPRLTYSLPPRVTAASGLDALCQAVESFWAVGATEQSIDYAAEALQLAATHLADAVRQPTPEARRGMCQAAHLAGQAIDIGKTTAPHALSYAITLQFDVPHGLAVATTLVPLLRYNARLTNADCADPRGSRHVELRIARMLDVLQSSDIDAACRRLEDLIGQVGGITRLAQICAPSDDTILQLAQQVNAERLSNNPRALGQRELIQLLNSIRGD